MSKASELARAERTAAAEALHAIQAVRPMKPPPFRFEGTYISAGALAVRREQRRARGLR